MTRARLLVVEDDGIIRMELVDRLQNLNYDVVSTAASGEEAVEQARDLRPDLVLMDIKLRGEMDGVEAAEQIRASLDVPVIYLTAYANSSTLQRARSAEPFEYIAKPFLEDDLRRAIEIALRKC